VGEEEEGGVGIEVDMGKGVVTRDIKEWGFWI
jgi:hypothetical protein